MFPYYLSIGMTYELFWDGEPELAAAYRKADAMRRRRTNEELWLNGVYMSQALVSTVGNMFSKGNKHKYPSEPLPITADDVQERKEREQMAKAERIKAALISRTLAINANIGGNQHDKHRKN